MKLPLFVLIFLGCLLMSGQTEKVKAQKGDGIFSVLRKQGLNPSKYYAEFVRLNKDNIKNGSELVEGNEYFIPDAPDSYKKTAVNAKENLTEDEPIFTQELAKISPKSDKLENAVLYLLPGLNGIKQSKVLQNSRNQIMRDVAQELMVHGAQVYLVDELQDIEGVSEDNLDITSENETAIADRNQMQHFVGTINKHYLQNTGKYQRVVVLNFNETAESSKYYNVSIFHHFKSQEGERFAQTFQEIFAQNSIKNSSENPIEVFQNESNLYLAKNVLPAVTMIDISGAQSSNEGKKISISPREKVLTSIIANGVMSDYANLVIEE